jgi:hypothetical protein
MGGETQVKMRFGKWRVVGRDRKTMAEVSERGSTVMTVTTVTSEK